MFVTVFALVTAEKEISLAVVTENTWVQDFVKAAPPYTGSSRTWIEEILVYWKPEMSRTFVICFITCWSFSIPWLSVSFSKNKFSTSKNVSGRKNMPCSLYVCYFLLFPYSGRWFSLTSKWKLISIAYKNSNANIMEVLSRIWWSPLFRQVTCHIP